MAGRGPGREKNGTKVVATGERDARGDGEAAGLPRCAGDPLPSGSAEEVELRACAVEAARQVAAAAPNGMTALAVDHWLWREGKRNGNRERERHATRDTSFY